MRGFARYPAAQVWRERSAFPSRQALLCYEDALARAAALDDALQVGGPVLVCCLHVACGLPQPAGAAVLCGRAGVWRGAG